MFATHRVRTARLEAERAAGRATFLKLGDMHGLTGVLLLALLALREKLVGKPPHEGAGTANTALAFHAGRLLALHEGDMPYALRVLCEGAVETLGRAGALHPGLRTFTAHPKLDASTGELLYFSYDLEAAGAAKQPHLTYGVLDAAGVKVHSTSVPLRCGLSRAEPRGAARSATPPCATVLPPERAARFRFPGTRRCRTTLP